MTGKANAPGMHWCLALPFVLIAALPASAAETVKIGFIEVLSGPADKPWGLREMAVRTPDGHRIMFCQPMAGR